MRLCQHLLAQVHYIWSDHTIGILSHFLPDNHPDATLHHQNFHEELRKFEWKVDNAALRRSLRGPRDEIRGETLLIAHILPHKADHAVFGSLLTKLTYSENCMSLGALQKLLFMVANHYFLLYVLHNSNLGKQSETNFLTKLIVIFHVLLVYG